MNFAELMFYTEAEGMLPTRAGKINAIVKDVRKYPSPTIDEETFSDIVESHGIRYNSLTNRELKYINSAIK